MTMTMTSPHPHPHPHPQTDTTHSIWARLPIELTREILLQLASTNLQTARTLRLVSRSTNVWVLPLLFRTLTLTTPDHITRFASTLLPKRRFHIPALKSNLHQPPRPLSSYSIHALALVLNSRLPSTEIALSKIAPALTNVHTLVVTAQNLSSNLHWMRGAPPHHHHQTPAIRPKWVMLPHFGLPLGVDWGEGVWRGVERLYTSVLKGLRGSDVMRDLPRLRYLAVHTRLYHGEETMRVLADEFLRILQKAEEREEERGLEVFAFVVDGTDGYKAKYEEWMRVLGKCLRYKSFVVLPHFRHPRMEWEGMLKEVEEANSVGVEVNERNVWERAIGWRAVQATGDVDEIEVYRARMVKDALVEEGVLRERKYLVNWEIDLVQREGYVSYEGDMVERREAAVLFPVVESF